MTRAILTLLLTGAASIGLAQQRYDETKPAQPDGLVEIESGAGVIRVVGWERNEIQVSAETGRGDDIEFEVHGGRTSIDLENEEHWQGGGSHSGATLEVRVPRGSRLEIDGSMNASVSVSGVAGRVSAEALNGDVTLEDVSGEVDAETVNGSVEIQGGAPWVRAESVNGRVVIRGASGAVEASTVNGRLEVTGGARFERARLEVVNGRILFEGELSPKALLEVESVAGDVELSLSSDVAADFRISSFSGEIDNDFGQQAERTSRWTTEKELSFVQGGGGAKVEVHTLSGDIRLRKRP
jgi:DUF4097 and DUF4098 domain-containing protein YvlB